MLIRYDADAFNPPLADLTNNNSFNCTWPKLVWSALTVGRDRKDVWISGDYSYFEAVYRIAMVYANLFEESQLLKQSPAFIRLDPSEKSAVSYFTGLFCSKLIADRYFRVPWLMHVMAYYDQLQPVIRSSYVPDLIGYSTSNEWIIIEAKGRSNGYDEWAQKKAREQKRSIASVRGQPIALCAAVQSYFSRGALSLEIDDPEDQSDNAIDLEITMDTFFRSYYKLLRDLLIHRTDENRAEKVKVGNQSFIVTTIEDADLQVGLLEHLFFAAKDFSFADWHPIMLDQTVDRRKYNDDLNFLGNDGILVRCGNKWLKQRV